MLKGEIIAKAAECRDHYYFRECAVLGTFFHDIAHSGYSLIISEDGKCPERSLLLGSWNTGYFACA